MTRKELSKGAIAQLINWESEASESGPSASKPSLVFQILDKKEDLNATPPSHQFT